MPNPGAFAELYPELDIRLRRGRRPHACGLVMPFLTLARGCAFRFIVALASAVDDDVGDELGDRQAIDAKDDSRNTQGGARSRALWSGFGSPTLIRNTW